MALPAWPDSLPSSPLLGTLQIGRTVEPPLMSEMNSGTTRSRRKYSLRIAPVSMAVLMTNEQAAALKTFHETTLGDGAARFTMPMFFAGTVATRNVKFADPPGFDHMTQQHCKVMLSLLVEAL